MQKHLRTNLSSTPSKSPDPRGFFYPNDKLLFDYL